MLKVWLREPFLSDDEAIKLILPENSDVSDVLLKAPNLLRVSDLKPSELQALYGNQVLSNRTSLKEVFSGENVGTIVVRAKNRENSVTGSPAPRGPPHQVHGKPPQRSLSSTSQGFHNHISSSSRAASRDGSTIRETGRNSFTRSSTSVCDTPHSGSATTRLRSPLVRQTSINSQSTVRLSTPKNVRSLSESSSSHKVSQTRRNTSKGRTSTGTATLNENHTSQNNESLNKRGRCTAFKQQWGNPLCATCGKSKQIHRAL